MKWLFLLWTLALTVSAQNSNYRRYLYMASPGIRNYLAPSGGHGILVFDRDNNYKFVKSIPTKGFEGTGAVIDNVKGFLASAITNRIYVSTEQKLECIDLITEKSLWEITCKGGCDRGALSPDGKIIVQAPLYQDYWVIYDALTGKEIQTVTVGTGFKSHNTIFNQNGKEAYLAGVGSKNLAILNIAQMKADKTIGPFSDAIRPFTTNGEGTLIFANVNNLIGFEVGSASTGKMMHRVDVAKEGFKNYVPGATLDRHTPGPSHGIALTADETEIWVVDGVNNQLHIYDVTSMPPKYKLSMATRVFPGWVNMSMDGKYAYPSSGEVIDVKTKKVVAKLTRPMDSELKALLGTDKNDPLLVEGEKLFDIDFIGNDPVRTGVQFGIGQMVGGKLMREGCMDKSFAYYDSLANKPCAECCGPKTTGISREARSGKIRVAESITRKKEDFHARDIRGKKRWWDFENWFWYSRQPMDK